MTRKFWRIGESRSVIGITETKKGEEKARKLGYKRITREKMTRGERVSLKAYDNDLQSEFLARYIG